MSGTYFVTGVTGFVGQQLLRLLAEDTNNRIYCFIRGTKLESAQDRFQAVLTDVGIPEGVEISLVTGDLRQPRMGIDVQNYQTLTQDVTNVIHAAADVRFNQPLEKIRDNNVGGAKRILEFSEQCHQNNPDFSHLDYVSTAFVAGRNAGLSREDALTDSFGFKNTYEQSKNEAEALVRSRIDEMPIMIYRPSIVLGFSENGRAMPRNVIYPMLKLFTKWKYPVISALGTNRLDLVPVDFVAKALLQISGNDQNLGKCFHLAAGPDGDVSIRRFVGLMKEEFGKGVILMPVWFWTRVVRPLLKKYKRDFYDRSTGIFRAFEPYIWEPNPRYSVDETKKALAGSDVSLPESDRFLRTCFKYAIDTDFGAKED